LGREDVARRPSDVGTEGHEGFDEDGSLGGHVQATGDSGTGKRLGFTVSEATGGTRGGLG
jgi:hypothetical protein